LIETRDVNRKPEIWFSVLKQILFIWQQFSNLFIFIFVKEITSKFHKNYQMSNKINLHTCLMLSVYKSFHQMVKYGHQRNHILQDLTGLKT